jgi:hypothetical protein
MSIQGRQTVAVGAQPTNLDIFVEDGITQQLIDPSGIHFRIRDPLGVDVITTTSGNKLSIGHYNASGVTIPASSPIGEGWKIFWEVVAPGGGSGLFVEEFCTRSASLNATFSSRDVGVETIFDRVRIDVGDPDGRMLTNGLLTRYLEKSIARCNRRLGLVDLETGNTPFHFFLFFTSALSRPRLEVNLLTGIITPDTDPYVDIIIMQMEELVLRAEMSNFKRLNPNLGGSLASGIFGATTEGVSVRNADGVTISVSPVRFSTRAKLFMADVERISAEVKEAIRDFRWRLAGAAGVDVTIPRYGYNYGTLYHGWGGRAR